MASFIHLEIAIGKGRGLIGGLSTQVSSAGEDDR
jgi:hypothetical protein